MGSSLKLGVFDQIRAFHPELTAFRRDLHANPELGFEEVRTAARVVEALKLCGVDEIHTGIGKTGVVATIRGRHANPGNGSARMVGLRADMDALPMQEEGDLAWKSTKAGLMHGCGHDGHTTMLVGAARHLAATRNFEGTAVLIFQPGEEGYAGAKAMIDDGLFERFPVEAVYAMHNWPSLPAGVVGLNPGPMMAAADRFDILIEGKGGHGAHPYLAQDPVVAAAHVITAVQSIVARNVSPVDSAVVSICAMAAGNAGAFSVIPRTARLEGTVRSFKPSVQDLVQQRLTEVAHAVAQGMGCTATLNYQRIYPATLNTPAQAQFAGDVAARLVGEDNVVRDMPPSMGAEDFSFMLQAKPGAYLRIGQGAATGEAGCFLHNTRYDFNDDILPLGAALYASLVIDALPPTRPTEP